MHKLLVLIIFGGIFSLLISCKKNTSTDKTEIALDNTTIQLDKPVVEKQTGVINFTDMDFPSKKIPQKYSGQLAGRSEEYFTFPAKEGEKMEIIIHGDSGLGMRVMSADKFMVDDLQKGEGNLVHVIDLDTKGTWSISLYVTKEARQNHQPVAYSINFQYL